VFRAGAAYLAVAWVIVQIAETTFPAFGLGDDAVRVVIILLAIALVPALALAWVFELTPEGLKRDDDLEPGSELSLRTNRMLDRLIVATLALGLAYFAFDKFALEPQRDRVREEAAAQRGRTEALVESYGDKSIAVLPFVNMSPDPEQEYFSDGIAEELLNLLARIPELRVISRSSSFTYKGKDLRLTQIAEELNVVHLLEGSVRKSGDRIRITAQLIDARSDTHLWSETYDRAMGDIFAIQDEIAAMVVAELQLKLLGRPPESRRTDLEVYALTMQANQLLNGPRRDPEKIIALLEQALALDPDYVPALNALAVASYQFANHWDRAAREAMLERNGELIDRALAIDPDDPVANAYYAWRIFDGEWQIQAAARRFERVAELTSGNAEVLRLIGGFARRIGHFPEAIAFSERMVALDPLCFPCKYQLALAHLEARDYAEAEAQLRRLVTLGGGGYFYAGLTQLLQGDAAGALATYEGALVTQELAPGRGPYRLDVGRAMALHDLGRHEESRAALDAAIDKGERKDLVAAALAWTGQVEAAIELLDEMHGLDDPRRGRFFDTIFNPAFDNLRDHPRYIAAVEKLGMSPEQLAAIEFNPRLPD
jgi:adenylate cyclase